MTNSTFHITVPAHDEDLAADRLWQLGVEAVGVGQEKDGFVELWTSVGVGEPAVQRAVSALEDTWSWWLQDIVPPDETWRDHVVPTWYRTGDVVAPAWQEPSPAVAGAVHCTLIEPASSFGLGDHPTTQLSLRLLAALLDVTTPASVLDVGCGSGVLGILAAQRGARLVRAIDVSSAAIEATVANAEINAVGERIEADVASLDSLDGAFDVVVANILAPVLIKLAPELQRLTAPTGTLIISGVLADGYAHVLESLAPLAVEDTLVTDGWAAVSLKR